MSDVYPSIRSPEPDRAGPGPEGADVVSERGRFRVGSNVIAIGMTSLVTDISSEMVNAILPLYLVFQLRMSPLAFGVFNGLYQGVAGVVRISGGIASDRRHRYKEVAGVGYGISLAAKLGLLAVGQAALPAAGILMIDRIGKGIRTSPRDALISLSAPVHRLAEAFGVHRTLDTTGALLGPVLAYLILTARPDDYDAVFVLSFLIGVVGLGVLVCFVGNRRPDLSTLHDRVRPSLRTAASLLADRAFRRLVVASAVLAAATIGDAFVYLTFQRQSDFTTQYFPLLYVGTAFAYLALAIPFGRIADRVGRSRVFLMGYLALGGAYLMLLVPSPGGAALIAVLGLLGVFYAATDGVLIAMVSVVVPDELRTSGIALLTTVTAVAGFVASVAFGAWWTWHGPVASVQLFLALLAAALIVGWLLLRVSLRGPGLAKDVLQ